AIASIAFDQPAPILDGNVMRVLTRIFGIAGNPRETWTNRRLWQIAGELVSRSAAAPRPGKNSTFACSRLNQSLMELGALVCVPRNPRCGECPAKKICVAFAENRVGDLPQLEKRGKATARMFLALVMERDGRFLVRRRPDGVVNANLWEFPNVEISDPGGNGMEKNGDLRRLPASAAKALGIETYNAKPICAVKHTITRYRMTLQAFEVRPSRMPRIRGGVWLTRRRLELLPFASAHRKVLAALKAQRLRRGQ
ncbi:MAG: NUDIX domain-containing protein, partial [Limisphaerales bacterium]